MIPLYDELNFIEYRNWDVYVLTFAIVALVITFLVKVLSAIFSCLFGSNPNKKTKSN